MLIVSHEVSLGHGTIVVAMPPAVNQGAPVMPLRYRHLHAQDLSEDEGNSCG